MTKRDFFILAIKLFGLMSVVTTLFSGILGNISFALMDPSVFTWVWMVIAVLMVIGLFILLIFKADKIVGLLKLEKGFDDERIELGNLASSDIVKIGSFIIGGILVIENIPVFLSHTFYSFKDSVVGEIYNSSDKYQWLASAIKIIVGYLLLTNFSFVASLLRTKKEEKLNQ